jgi:hypothetical protein
MIEGHAYGWSNLKFMLSKAMKLRFDNCEMQAKIIAKSAVSKIC